MSSNCSEYIHGKSYAAMSTEQLRALLSEERDADRKELDLEKIEAITSVLDGRTEVPDFDVETGWRDFEEVFLSKEPKYPFPNDTEDLAGRRNFGKKHSLRIILIASIIVVVIIGGTITASATNFWDLILSWTGETFGLVIGNTNESKYERSPELMELFAAVYDDGIDDELVPRYLPEGYKKKELYKENGYYVGVYSDGSRDDIIIQVHILDSEKGSLYEQDNEVIEEYKVNNITHYIASNTGTYTAVWYLYGYECIIAGVPNKNELIEMVNSIYLEE